MALEESLLFLYPWDPQGQRSLANIKVTLFSGGSDSQESSYNAGDPAQSLGREDPVKKEMAAQYSCLENPMDRGAW